MLLMYITTYIGYVTKNFMYLKLCATYKGLSKDLAFSIIQLIVYIRSYISRHIVVSYVVKKQHVCTSFEVYMTSTVSM